MANYQIPIGGSHVFDANEAWQGAPAPAEVPVTWTCNQGNGSITLTPDPSDPNKVTVAAVAGNAPQTGVVLIATINPGGPSGQFTIDTIYQVDTITIVPE